ncbi:MAG: DUF167 domain-containing protein [Hyphomicrobiaceae bacterium]|nr:DUF167 domain-containing protein [Hyphomicrobiaceae bacterium]
MAEAGRVWRETSDGLIVRIRATPRAERDAVGQIIETADGPAIAVRVRTVAQDGRANAACEATVAEWLGLAKSCVALTSGGKSRIKSLLVMGNVPSLIERIERNLADPPARAQSAQ